MGDLKQIRRLSTGAEYAYADGPGGLPTLRLTEVKDGGEYGMHPLLDADPITGNVRLLVPHPTQPSYTVSLECDADTAGRLGRALLGAQRKANGQGDASDEE